MIYDVLNRCRDVLKDNFKSDMEDVVSDKSVSNVNTDITVHDRTRAAQFLPRGPLPACGVYFISATTMAKYVGRREYEVEIAFEYSARHRDPAILSQQIEMAEAAIMRTVDRLGEDTTTRVLGAGESPGSVEIAVSPPEQIGQDRELVQTLLITVPVREEDTSL